VNGQLAAFRKSWAKVNMRYARSRNLTPYDVLIIASMVEEEVVAPEERRLVAAVIYNRLKAGMTLGIDATLRYGLGISPTESIRQSQLDSDNPYNTRKLAGLPPTPITNPTRLDAGRGASARTNYSVLRARRTGASLLSASASSRTTRTRTATDEGRADRLPVGQSLSPRMQNAAFPSGGSTGATRRSR
jgi:UPF0755 protein